MSEVYHVREENASRGLVRASEVTDDPTTTMRMTSSTSNNKLASPHDDFSKRTFVRASFFETPASQRK